MKTIETTNDGRFFIRTTAGNVARNTSCEPWFIRDPAKAQEALNYLTLDYASRKRAAHWLKSTFGIEG